MPKRIRFRLMKIPVLLLICIATAAFGQVPAAPPRELESLKSRYEADVQAALKPIKARYEQQLQSLQKSLTTKGDLNGALAVKEVIDSLKLSAPDANMSRVVGYWRFDNGAKMEIKEDGTTGRPDNPKTGRWSWTNSAKGELRIRWERHSDDLVISEDGQKFTGMSSTQTPLRGGRIPREDYTK
jgi:hypothetical protein